MAARIPTTSRRGALGVLSAIAGLAAGATVAQAARTDAELLGLAATIRRALSDHLAAIGADDEDAQGDALDRYSEAVSRVADIPAEGPEGALVKAGLLILGTHLGKGTYDEAIADSLTADLLCLLPTALPFPPGYVEGPDEEEGAEG